MKRSWKRTLSMLMVMVMLLGLVPTQVFAVEDPQTAEDPRTVEDPQTADPVAAVQAMIDGLDTDVSSDEEATALNDALAEVADAIAELTAEEAEALDLTRYEAAAAALAAYTQQPDEPEELEYTPSGETLEVLDGELTAIELAVLATEGYSVNSTDEDKRVSILSGYSDITLDNGDKFYTWKNTGKIWKPKWEIKNTYTIKVYHNISVVIEPTGIDGCGVRYKNEIYGDGKTFTYYPGDEDKIEVLIPEGYELDGTAPSGTPNASGEFKLTYKSTATEKHTVTYEVENDDLGETTFTAGTETLVSGTEYVKGTPITIEAAPHDTTNTVAVITVNGESSGNSFTVGTEDMTITVTYKQLTAANTATVKFNGYYTAAEQMDTLPDAIVKALGLQFNGKTLNYDEVTIQYWPWYSAWMSGSGYCDGKDDIRNLADAAKDNFGTFSYYDFGERFRDETYTASDKNTEKVVISYKVDDNTTLSVTREITLTEGRKELTPTTYTADEVKFTAENAPSDGAVKTAAAKAVTAVTLSADDFKLPENWQDSLNVNESVNITATATFTGDATYQPCTLSVTVPVRNEVKPATIKVDNGDQHGDVTITDKDGKPVTDSAFAGNVTVTVTPHTDKAYYVDSLTVTGADATVSNDGTKFTATFTVENEKEYTVKVAYKERTLDVLDDPEISVNGYLTEKTDGIKEKIVAAVLGDTANPDDYTVSVHNGLRYVATSSPLFKSEFAALIKVGESITVKIELPADGKLPAVTAEGISVKVVESRKAATISYAGLDSISADTEALFKSEVEKGIQVKDGNGTDISDKTLLASVTAVPATEGESFPITKDGTTKYKITVKTLYEGETWTHAEETTFYVTAKVNCYPVTWKDGNGNTLKTEDVPYGQTPAYTGETPTKTMTDAEVFTWDNGWTPALAPMTAAGATYTATFSETARKYDIKWDTDGDGVANTTTQVAYNETPIAPSYTAPEGMSFERWDPEITVVKGEASYKAVFSKDTIYTVTFMVNGAVYGTPQRINLTKVPGAVIADPGTPEKPGFVFDGWTSSVEGMDIGQTPTADVIFTAQWAADINGNKVDDKDETITIIEDKSQDSDAVTITGAKQIDGTTQWVYNSKGGTVTITATPTTHLDSLIRYSDTYVKEILLNGKGQTLTYGDNYAVKFTFTPQNGNVIRVTFADAGFQWKTERVLSYYPGMKGVTNEMLYNAIVNAPEWDADTEITVQYLAREKQTTYLPIDDLPWGDDLISQGVKKTAKALFKDGIPIELGDLWQDANVELDSQIEESLSLTEAINQYFTTDSLKSIDALKKAIEDVTKAVTYHGAHNFGYNATDSDTVTEKMRLTYKDSARNISGETDITLRDTRLPSYITAGNTSLVYKDFLDTELASALNIQVTDKDGKSIPGAQAVTTASLAEKDVSETGYQVTFKFAGNETYKPSETTLQVTIAQAAASIDVPNVVKQYGEAYSMAPTVTRNNQYGADTDITDSLIQFVVGLDVAGLTVEDQKLSGVDTTIQLILPKTITGSLGDLFKDGATLSLKELIDALEALDSFISADALATLKQALEAIIDAVDVVGGLEITLGGQLPTDIGTYLYGAVSTNSNYETAFDVAYIVITPKADRVYLDWNYRDSNGIFTQDLLKTVDLGASAYDDAAHTAQNDKATEQVRNLIFGVNQDEESGKLKLTLEFFDKTVEDPNTIESKLGNGAFTQMAFIAEFGNEMYYAVPIVRAFAIVPNTVKVEFVDENGNVNADRKFTYDGKAHGMTVRVNGTVMEPNEALSVTYMGVTTAGKTYRDTKAPTESGAYTVIATYTAYEGKNLTAVGAAVGAMAILPAKTETAVDDAVITRGERVELDELIHVTGGKGETPDMTVITARIATDGSFTDNGWDAVQGNVNIDFPAWVDAILAERFPESFQNGMTAAEFSAKISGKLTKLVTELELGDELTKALTDMIGQVNGLVSKLPDNVTLTFKETAGTAFDQVGAYLVCAIVTDSNYLPSADYGLVVVQPKLEQVYLDWNWHDDNGIWTQTLLSKVDLGATAYDDADLKVENTAATDKIVYRFLSVDQDGKLTVSTDAKTLKNGAYIQLAYIPLELDGAMTLSTLIARPMLVIPDLAKVEFVDESGNVNADRKFTYDGKAHGMTARVTVDNKVVTPKADELTVTYMGVTTAGKTYRDTKAPTESGAYTVIATYAVYKGDELVTGGAAVGAMAILPAQVDFSVTGGTFDYDGNAHGVTVSPANVDYTLISGTASVAGNVTEVGLEAISANLNVDFPAWVDQILKEKFPDAYANGIGAAKLIEKLEQYRDTLTAVGIQETWLDAVINALEKVPSGMQVTFKDQITCKDPGTYVFLGILTDFNYVPAYDTGLVIIRKEASGLAFVDSEITYDGKGHLITVTNPKNTDYVTVIIDRENNIGNILFEDDLKALKTLLEKQLGQTMPTDIDASKVQSAINTALTQIESIENLPEDAAELLKQLRKVLSELPQSGTVYLDGVWRPTNVGTYEFYGLAVSPQYATTTMSGKLTIKPAEVTITVDNKTKVYGEADPTFTGTVTGVIEGDDLHVVYKRAEGQTGEDVDKYTITATYTEDPNNYDVTVNDGTLTITAKTLTKEFAKATLDGSLTYNGSEQTQKVKLADGITYEVSGNTGTDAKGYTLTITGTGNYTGTLELPWSIAKKPATVTVGNLTIKKGETPDLNKVSVTKSGFVDSDDIQITLSVVGTEIQATVTGERSGNYEITVVPGTLTIKDGGNTGGDGGDPGGDGGNTGGDSDPGGNGGNGGSGGGGGGAASGMVYDITVKNDQNGTVKANYSEAAAGTTVVLTSVPKKGYTLQSLTVTRDKGGKTVELTRETGRYTFVMPASDVTVTAVYTTGGASFGDVPDDAYYSDAVYWAAESGIANGVTAGVFDPNGICTRAQAVTFLWRAAGCPAPKTQTNPFTDVLPGFYYYDAVLWAVENGITKGTTETTFSPDMTCSRGHIVTFLWRAQGTPAPKTVNVFTDVVEGAYYADAALWAVENGITKGMTATMFAPTQGCTRAQIVTFLYRYFSR